MNVELRGNAMVAELVSQRNQAMDRCAMLAADNAELRAEIEMLRKRLSDLESAK